MATTTTNMSLKVWDLLTDNFSYTDLANNFEAIDEHDHTTGAGVPIPAGGLAVGSVGTAQLQTASVTNSKLANGSVDSSKLGINSIAGDKIVDNSISTIKLIDNVVTTPKIANGAVTLPKIAPLLDTTSVTPSSNLVLGLSITAIPGMTINKPAGTYIVISNVRMTADSGSNVQELVYTILTAAGVDQDPFAVQMHTVPSSGTREVSLRCTWVVTTASTGNILLKAFRSNITGGTITATQSASALSVIRIA